MKQWHILSGVAAASLLAGAVGITAASSVHSVFHQEAGMRGETSDKPDKGDKDTEDKDEKKIDAGKLPDKVVAAVKAAYPDGKITDAEEQTKDNKKQYELDVKNGDKTWEVVVSEDGTIISQKEDKED